MSTLPAPLPTSITPSFDQTGLTRAQAANVLFGMLAALFLIWPIWRIAFPLEINRNEPWNAWFVDAILHGAPLYPAREEFIVNNYPPLSFYAVALLSKLTGDVVYAGRLISLISTAAISVSIALCIRALGGSRPVALFGALWFLATIAHFFTRYVGVNDPNLLALAVMGLALALFLTRLSKEKSVAPAIALMVLAGFIKHNLIAIPLAALIWLSLKDRGEGLRATLLGIALAALGLLICASFYGPNFLQQMLMPRQISIAHMLSIVGKLQWFAPALLFWGLWAWPNRNSPEARFSALLIGVSLASDLLQAAGAGVSINAHFEILFATGIAVALAFEGIGNTPIARRFGARAIQMAMILVLVLRLVLSQQLEPYLVLASPGFRQEVGQNLAAMDAEVERIRLMPGPVACSTMAVCYRAGKAFVYDDFWMGQLLAKGRWTKDAVDQAVKERGIRFEKIGANVQREKKRLF
jgi:hypothetical protein